jgi:hypothetical protein
MKKIFLWAIPMLLMSMLSFAQQFSVQKSPEFDEPEYGWNKLLQLKNGYTFFFHGSKKEGVELTVYNPQRRVAAKRELNSKLWDVDKIQQTTIRGLYEINGEAVLFVVQGDERQPTLYRMRLNGTTGMVVKEDELGRLPKMGMGAGYALSFGHVDMPDIIVEKDPESDNYAVIFFNSLAHDRSERIRVLHYGSDHKVLSDAFYDSPDGMFKYLTFIACAVDGNKRVFVTTYARSSNAEDVASRVIVSSLNAGDTAFKHNLLEFSEDFKDTKAVMLYNHNDNKLQLLTLTYERTKKKMFSGTSHKTYLVLMSYIDPATLKLLSVKPFAGDKIQAYGKNNIDEDYEFTGMPQDMFINKDNTTTILFEQNLQVTEYNGHVSHTYTLLGPVGVSEMNDTGAEMAGYAINKKQHASGVFPLLYLNQRAKGQFFPTQAHIMFKRGDNNEFLSYDYINAPGGHYVIFNDLPGNFEKDEDETKRKTMAIVSNSDAMCFKLNGGSIDKMYLFGEPDGKHSATFAYIESSDYNKDTHTYATLIVEKDGRDKAAKIAWVTFK